MGVKDLWNVLGPVSQKTPLYSLQGKSVAIDLSCWVCEGQSIGDRAACTQPRMYLRNVFFRTLTLLMMNVTPIFVLEGDAPEAKLDAMKQRNDARFHRYRDPSGDGETAKKSSSRNKGGRSRFKGILKQCKTMLDMMGVACVQSDGEAEALCAQLNRERVVDAAITQDSDVFLYGATTVYRNLTIKSGSGTVDVYTMSDIEEKLHLDRAKLVAMSVLCGCDYDLAGVHGVGKEMAFKYLSSYRGDVLQRLRSLRNDKALQRLEDEKNGCGKCGHTGKVSEHKKSGCLLCGTTKGCEEDHSSRAYKNLSEEEKKDVALELNLRRKALQDPNFPNETTIKEFMDNRQELGKIDKAWKRPEICKFVKFCAKMLEWEIDYAFEKILPLYTRWLLLFSRGFTLEDLLPKEILKKRVVRGVASLDIGWQCMDENLKEFLTFLPEDCSCFVNGLCVTVEPQILVSEKLSELHAEFIERTAKKKPVKVPRAKKSKNVDDLSNALADLAVESTQKAKRGRKPKAKAIKDADKESSLTEKIEKKDDYRIPWEEGFQYMEDGIFDANNCSITSHSPLRDKSFDQEYNLSPQSEVSVTGTLFLSHSPKFSGPKSSVAGNTSESPELAAYLSMSKSPGFEPSRTEHLPFSNSPKFDTSELEYLEIMPALKVSTSEYLAIRQSSEFETLSTENSALRKDEKFQAEASLTKSSSLRTEFQKPSVQEANFDITFDFSNLFLADASSPVCSKSARVTADRFDKKCFGSDVSVADDTVVISEDESTIDYDLSAILDDIIARKRNY